MNCDALLDWFQRENLWSPALGLPPCDADAPVPIRLPAPPRGRVVAVPEAFFFAPVEALVDVGRTCTHDVPLLTAKPGCGVRFFRPLPGRPRWEPPPPEPRALWVVSPGWNEGPRFAAYHEVFAAQEGPGRWFAEADREELMEAIAAGVEGLFLIGHGDEAGKGFWLRRRDARAVRVRFGELKEALLAAPGRLFFLFAFLCDSAETLHRELLLPLAQAGKLARDFGAVLFLGSPLHDHGPAFLRALLDALKSPDAQRDPAPFLYALARARGTLYRLGGLKEAAKPIAFVHRPQAHPWPPSKERRYLAALARMLEASDG